MTRGNRMIPDELYDYIVETTLRDDPILARLRDETAPMPMAGMQIAADQGQFMALLTGLVDAKKALEVGVFTGYSSISVARALPADGLLVACDVSEEYTSIAKKYWEEAGVASKIDLRLGPAADTLAAMVDAGDAGSFDIAFIDADKGNYPVYYELCLELLRTGGLIIVDNAFMGGRAIDPAPDDDGSRAIDELNRSAGRDERVDVSLIPVGDGLLLARKR